MFAALPPLALGWLAWIAPVPWLLLIRRESFSNRRPYWKLWLAGVLFWLLAIYWLLLPHPATSIGWVALSCYLGCYLPTFVALSRVGVHRLHMPLVLVGPVIWTGLELVRAYLLGGFLMASLAHTQVDFITLIQISDLAGEYAVSFLVMLIAAAIADVIVNRRWFALLIAIVAVAAAIGYGEWRLGENTTSPGPRVALIQGNTLADWKHDETKRGRIMKEYWYLSVQAVADAKRTGDRRPADLVIWPETMFRYSLLEFTDAYASSPHATAWGEDMHELTTVGPATIANLVSAIQTPVLLGIDAVRYDVRPDGEETVIIHNGAVLADRSGKITSRYAKVRLVMFGEYVPFADWFPWLARLTPLPLATTPGTGPAALVSAGVTYAPNICYESVMPHYIRGQVTKLSAQGDRPDVLVNITNDAWYWGASELDMHLACDVFRAVETRTPMVVAANGGLSAYIDSLGRVVQVSTRQQPEVILADVALDSRVSLYTRRGDWFAGTCLAVCGIMGVLGVWRRGKSNVSTGERDA